MVVGTGRLVGGRDRGCRVRVVLEVGEREGEEWYAILFQMYNKLITTRDNIYFAFYAHNWQHTTYPRTYTQN